MAKQSTYKRSQYARICITSHDSQGAGSETLVHANGQRVLEASPAMMGNFLKHCRSNLTALHGRRTAAAVTINPSQYCLLNPGTSAVALMFLRLFDPMCFCYYLYHC